MSNQLIPIERDQPFVIPVQEWLTQDHLARFIVALAEGLDASGLEASYGGGGSPPYPPKMMLTLLFYGYATGIFSSRKLERATYELIPVIYITGNTHPYHNSINAFRKRFVGELGDGVFNSKSDKLLGLYSPRRIAGTIIKTHPCPACEVNREMSIPINSAAAFQRAAETTSNSIDWSPDALSQAFSTISRSNCPCPQPA